MFKFDDVHMIGAKNIASMARECGVKKLIHFSAMNCSKELQTHYVPGGSRFLRSKVSFLIIRYRIFCCTLSHFI